MVRRLLVLFILLFCFGTAARFSTAQTERRLQPGDPPLAALISLSSPDANGLVTLNGASGSVFSGAYVAVRNLYTQETVFTRAGVMGSFSVQLYGPGSTPFLIVPATNAPSQNASYPGSLPGGPGIIIYGSADSGLPVERLPRRNSDMPENAVSFTLAGRGGIWSAAGRANRLAFEAGDRLLLELDVTLNDQPPSGVFAALLDLQPVATEDGAVAAAYSSNGWSNVLTPSRLAINNLTGSVPLGEMSAQLQPDDDAAFRLDFAVTLPDDLLAGLYVPTLTVTGDDLPVRLPLVLNIGGIDQAALPLALLMNHPSEGSRGVLPEASAAALSSRVRYDSPTYILPPGAYPVEPYLPNLLPNRYDLTLPPLLPFALPGGRLDVQIIRPNNTRNQFNSLSIQQNQLSTPAQDESDLFGRQSPVDIYRLTSGAPALAAYEFDQYGEYQIQLTAQLEDIWGNHYTGGGSYHVVIAELLDLTPGVLTGTPFQIGDHFNPSLHIAPGFPADVSIRARVYPLDGSPLQEQVFEGQANRYGYFHAAGQDLVFNRPGEYVIDYEARYRASDGRLWAASFRSAGVIGTDQGNLAGHGARGLAGLDDAQPRPAWYRVSEYAQVLEQSLDGLRLNTPYHSGDVVWLGADASSGIQPVIRAQALVTGDQTALDPPDPALARQTREAELPVTLPSGAALLPPDSMSYTYFSAARPDVTARQMVIGGDDGGLPLDWDSDDPYNGQIGTGFAGDQPGDYLFLFGGAVSRSFNEIATYAALAVITDNPNEARVYPPGRGADGGADGGPLLVIDDEAVDMFFHPTAARPGDTLVIGDTLSIAGQVAPTLPAAVSAVITSPSGVIRSFEGVASAIGYFYDPARDFAVDEIGVWTVTVRARQTGLTSAGQVEPPLPQGRVLGTREDGVFLIYVVPEDMVSLSWNPLLVDITIPAALAYNFNFNIPEGWSDVRIYRTLTTPGYILEDGELRLNGRSFSYQYHPTNQRLSFPNIEVEGRVAGAAASDAKVLTFAISGVDSDGIPQIRTRAFTILHDRLISLSDG